MTNVYLTFDYSTTKKLARITENRHISMDNMSLSGRVGRGQMINSNKNEDGDSKVSFKADIGV